MDFTFDNTTGSWTTRTNIRGHSIQVRLKDPQLRPASTKDGLVHDALCSVDSQWDAIQEAILEQLYDIYRRSWVPEGEAPLGKEEFLRTLVFSTIQIEIEDAAVTSLFLSFDDREVFGGHSIEVFVDGADGELSVDIVG